MKNNSVISPIFANFAKCPIFGYFMLSIWQFSRFKFKFMPFWCSFWSIRKMQFLQNVLTMDWSMDSRKSFWTQNFWQESRRNIKIVFHDELNLIELTLAPQGSKGSVSSLPMRRINYSLFPQILCNLDQGTKKWMSKLGINLDW